MVVTVNNGRYRVSRRLGGGAFGEVYIVQSTAAPASGADPEVFAAKFEPVRSSHQQHLFHEARVYASLVRHTVTVGIPRVRWFGVEGDFNILIMELVGPSLADLLDYCHGRLSLKTTLMLADQLIARLEFVHTAGYIHRDLKPDNFAMGTGKRSHHLYLIDFGLAKRYVDVHTHKHIPYKDGKSLTGTARFVSINTHLGVQQSRRDDLEGAALVLIFLMKGTLPWQNLKCATKAEKYEKIKSMKLATPTSILCVRLPPCFQQLLTYSRALEFEQKPDYQACRDMFAAEMQKREWSTDYAYSWVPERTDSEEDTRMSTASTARAGSEFSPENTARRQYSELASASGFMSPNASMRKMPRNRSGINMEELNGQSFDYEYAAEPPADGGGVPGDAKSK
jgi:serine/threonine protein kinase